MMQSRSKRNRRRCSGSRLPIVLPEEGDQPSAVGRQPVEVAVEVAHHGVDREAGVLVGQGGGRRPQGARRSRRAARSAAGVPVACMASSSTRDLSQVPAPSSTRVSAPERRGDLRGVGLEDGALGPGRVVLGQPGDLVEQLAAPVVVEPDRRQPLGRGREPGPHVALQGAAEVVGASGGRRWSGDACRGGHRGGLSRRGPAAGR